MLLRRGVACVWTYPRQTSIRFLSASTPQTPEPPSPDVEKQKREAERKKLRDAKKVPLRIMYVGMLCAMLGTGRFYWKQWAKPPVRQEDAEVGVPRPVDERFPTTAPAKLKHTLRNPVVFLDISIDDEPAGRMYIRLRGDMAPLATENFLDLCRGNPLRTLRNTGFHRALPGALIQGGLLSSPSQPAHAYDVGEDFTLKPDGPYWVGMAETVASPDPNHSQFFVTTNATPTLEGKHVIFGRVIEGHAVIHAIENRFSIAGGASSAIRVTQSGQVQSEARMEFIRVGPSVADIEAVTS